MAGASGAGSLCRAANHRAGATGGPIDPAAPDDAPDRLRDLTQIEACHSVAGEESYILKVRVSGPAALEALLQDIRAAANVSTRTTVVLSTPYEGRSPHAEIQEQRAVALWNVACARNLTWCQSPLGPLAPSL